MRCFHLDVAVSSVVFVQEIQPTLDELGLNTVEELGYDKPELALKSVYDM